MAKKTTDSIAAPYEEKPTLRINADELPQISKWSIDGEYTLNVKVKMRNVGKSDYPYTKNPKVWATFTVEDVSADDDDDFQKGMDSYQKPPRTKGK